MFLYNLRELPWAGPRLRTSYGELGAGAGVIWGCRRGLSGDLDRVGGMSGDQRASTPSASYARSGVFVGAVALVLE